MPITIPDRKRVRITTTRKDQLRRFGGVAAQAFVNPCPVKITGGVNGPRVNNVIRATSANKQKGYVGFLIAGDIEAGATLNEEAVAIVNGCVIDGFAGVVPGDDVWIDPTATPAPEGVFSGLTHTDPATGAQPIGTGWTSTRILIFAR